jgi:prevent-host-death family protein
MDESVSAADANRRFSLLLRRVREGRSFVVTSHGRAVARIVPASDHGRISARARTALMDRLEQQAPIPAASWTREELYEDDPG